MERDNAESATSLDNDSPWARERTEVREGTQAGSKSVVVAMMLLWSHTGVEANGRKGDTYHTGRLDAARVDAVTHRELVMESSSSRKGESSTVEPR
jgi:hypothetical protein